MSAASKTEPRGDVADLLVEVGTEELPPKTLRTLGGELGAGVTRGLREHALNFDPDVRLYATPRRLAVLVKGLALRQADTVVERRGPPLARAFDERGVPTPAATGFAQSCGTDVAHLERLETDRGAWLTYRQPQPGRPATELLPAILHQALERLPVAKRMRWNAFKTEFVRPVHWAVVLLGDQVVACEILGVPAGRKTYGHRFHHPGPLSLAEPRDYAPRLLSEGRVVADFDRRRESIHGQVAAAAETLGGAALADPDLLDEVTGLVEWPVTLVGSFERRFLEVPQEALVSAMRIHQKCFPVTDTAGRLLPHFIAVSNIESRDPAAVRAGFERVIRPRLADALFFWNQDRRTALASRSEALAGVIFQQGLGSLRDKSRRLAQLIQPLAAVTGADPAQVRRGAELSKCDLLTRMVEEFPELQGIMGRYYALHDGEPEQTARAVEEQYLPRFAGDVLPATPAGQALALADKADTLVGVFAVGQAPTGDKDPFALRRAALGVIRIIIERDIDLDLEDLIDAAARGYNDQVSGLVTEAVRRQVMDFIMGRLRVYYARDFEHDAVNAVLAVQASRLADLDKRLRALAVFRTLPEAVSLAAANKRIANILKQAGVREPGRADPGIFAEPQERTLADSMNRLAAEVAPLIEAHDYERALIKLAALRQPVDEFFDRVMVMVDDEKLRRNRLALLHGLRALFTGIIDLSALQ